MVHHRIIVRIPLVGVIDYLDYEKTGQQNQDDRTHSTVRTRDGEKVFLQRAGSRIQTSTKASHGDDGTTNGMNRLQGELVSLHALPIQVVHQLSLSLLVTCQELHRAVTMRTDTLTAIY